jgi:hypothetical protein
LARIPRCVHNQSGQARAGDEPAWGQLWTNQSTAMHRAVGDAATGHAGRPSAASTAETSRDSMGGT